jgi:DNA polymerase III subunit chi|tara:strand:- start:677 stop:1105 length:429 start_codon:yes stop_codon:yes gene_type:complete
MTNITFYRITGNYNAVILLTCRLTEKAFQQNLPVLIHTPEEAMSEKINKELWSFKATTFLPHQIEKNPSTSISISHHLDPGNHDALLINMSSHLTPDWFSRFRKVVEIVYDDAQVIAKKRERYSFYQSRGYPIKYHDLTRAS